MAQNAAIQSSSRIGDQMEIAKTYIKAKDYVRAKAVLEGIDHPKARQWLEKIEELEMFGQPATESSSASDTASPFMTEVVSIFLQNGWQVSSSINGTTMLEKKRGPNKWVAAAAIVFFSIVGSLLVMAAISTAKAERITLSQAQNGVKISGTKQNFVTRRPEEVMSVANSVPEGATYASALLLGLGSFIFWLMLF